MAAGGDQHKHRDIYFKRDDLWLSIIVGEVAPWLRMLLAAVIVFVASSIIWMVRPIHKHD